MPRPVPLGVGVHLAWPYQAGRRLLHIFGLQCLLTALLLQRLDGPTAAGCVRHYFPEGNLEEVVRFGNCNVVKEVETIMHQAIWLHYTVKGPWPKQPLPLLQYAGSNGSGAHAHIHSLTCPCPCLQFCVSACAVLGRQVAAGQQPSCHLFNRDSKCLRYALGLNCCYITWKGHQVST